MTLFFRTPAIVGNPRVFGERMMPMEKSVVLEGGTEQKKKQLTPRK